MSLSGWDENKKIKLSIPAQSSSLPKCPVLVNLAADQRPDSVNDDFAGDDGDAPNSALWSVAPEDFEIQNNSLAMLATASPSWHPCTSKYSLSGDHTAQVDVDLAVLDASNYGDVVLQSIPVGDNEITIGVKYDSGKKLFFKDTQNGSQTTGATQALTVDSFKLRLVKSGTTYSGYYDVGSGWELLDSATFSEFSGDSVVRLGEYLVSGVVVGSFDNFQVNSGTIVWPDSSLPGSGVTGFDASQIFDELTPLDVDDDFTGTDGDAPDARLWNQVLRSSDSVTIDNNQLNITSDGTIAFGTYSSVSSKYSINGDFDVQVYYALINVSTSSWVVQLLVPFDTNSNGYIRRQHNGSINEYAGRCNIDGVDQTFYTSSTSDNTGYFRITRVETLLTAMYSSNGIDWTTMWTYSTAPTGDANALCQLYGADGQITEVSFDNFQVNSGTVVWPETPKKIAFERLNPDSVDDDFTGNDGDVPDVSLWDVGADFTLSANALAVYTARDTDLNIPSLYRLTGDFDISQRITESSVNASLWELKLGIRSVDNSGHWCAVSLRSDGSGGHGVRFRYDDDGANNSQYDVTTAITSCYVRFVRSGSQLTAYYKENIGDSWITVGSTVTWVSNDTIVEIATWQSGSDDPVYGLMDNFQLNSGTIVWPHDQYFAEIERWDATNKSAQLWIAPDLSTSATLLNLYYDSSHADNTTYIGDTGDETVDVITPITGFTDFASANVYRVKMAAAGVTSAGGSGIKIKFAHAGTDIAVSSCYVGLKGAGDFDFDGNQVSVKSGGSVSFTVDADGFESDIIDIDIDGSSDLVISIDSDRIPYVSNPTNGTTAYLGSADAGQDSFAGYTTSSNWVSVSGVTSAPPAQQVWNDDIKFLSHQAQDPTTSILDSTSYAKHGTSYGTMTSDDLVDGLSGKAIEYDGTDDYTNHGYDAAHDITDVLTIRAVIKPNITLDSGLVDGASILGRQHDPTDSQDTYGLFINLDGELQLGSQGGNTQSTKNSWTAGETFVIHATYNSTGLVGDLFVDGVKETLSVNALDTMAGSTNNLVIGKNDDAGAFFPGSIDEVMIVNAVLSDDWIATDNLSLRDQLITFSIPDAVFMAFIEMPYADLRADHMTMSDMIYSMLFPRQTFVEMIYSAKLGLAMAMHYGDAPTLLAIQNQYYGDAPAIMRSMLMKYGDLLMLQKSTEMPYYILKPLQTIMEARYGINGESLQAIMEQNYSLSEYNLLLKKLDMPYLLQSDSMVQTVSTSLTIGGNTVAFTHLNIERSHASFVITGEARLADLTEYMQISVGDAVEATCNATTYHLIVESKKRSRPGGAATTFIVDFVSPAIQLSAPWSRPLLQEFDPATAETIINDLVGDLGPVEYLTETFPVLADTLYANDEDARTVIRKLTQSVGAWMQSDPDGSIRVEPEYPVTVTQWGDVEPDYYLTDERNFVSQDESPVRNSGENKYLVGNQLSSDERTWTEQNSISDFKAEVLGFQVPWVNKEVYGLTHSGGDTVHTPEYMGVVEETYPPLTEPAEQVEFVAGFSSSQRPIYGDLEITWLREQLGSITYAEDGKLEAELKTGDTDGYSLAAIRYTTKYHKWIVRDDIAEDVQFILWVAE